MVCISTNAYQPNGHGATIDKEALTDYQVHKVGVQLDLKSSRNMKFQLTNLLVFAVNDAKLKQ